MVDIWNALPLNVHQASNIRRVQGTSYYQDMTKSLICYIILVLTIVLYLFISLFNIYIYIYIYIYILI